MHLDVSFLPAIGAAFLLVFARTGTMVMLLPGLGEQNISPRLKLTIALVLAAVLLPLHRPAYHIDTSALGPAIVLLVEEIMIGAVLGLTARVTISALEVAGSVIAQQLGLGFVTTVDPTQGEQGVKTASGAFRIGIQLSAPFLAFGLLFNIGLGVLSRLMPQMQVFFVALPLSILIGLLFLLLVLGTMMGFFLDYVGGVLHELAPHP